MCHIPPSVPGCLGAHCATFFLPFLGVWEYIVPHSLLPVGVWKQSVPHSSLLNTRRYPYRHVPPVTPVGTPVPLCRHVPPVGTPCTPVCATLSVIVSFNDI